MTPYTAPELVNIGIARGLVTPAKPSAPRQLAPMSDEQREYNRKKSLEYYHAKAAEYLARGLTVEGKPRQRRTSLTDRRERKPARVEPRQPVIVCLPEPEPEAPKPIVSLPDLSTLSQFERDWIEFRSHIEIPDTDPMYELNNRKRLFG